jgi:ACR3 family arsenite efflux pump ArsB
MIAGLAYGYADDPQFLKSLIIPLTILMIYPMMVGLNLKSVLGGFDWKLQGATQAINFLVIPFIAFFIGKLFLGDYPLLAFGLLLMALLPTSGMTVSWTGFAKGNIVSAVKMTVIGLVLGSLLTPFYANLLMGKIISVPLMKTFQQIGLVIFIPLILGNITRRILIKKYGEAHYKRDIKPNFSSLSALGVVGIIFVAMSLKAQMIISNPNIIVYLFLPLLVFYFLNYLVSSLVGRYLFARGDGIALVYGTVMRNLSVALAIAMTVFGSDGADIALIIAVGYVLQVQSAVWYIKFSPKIFGPAPEDTARDAMKEGVFSLSQNATLREAARLLDEEHIHSVAVLSSREEPVGLITEDMIINMVAEGKDLNAFLKEIPLKPIISCKYDTPLPDIIKKMGTGRKLGGYAPTFTLLFRVKIG